MYLILFKNAKNKKPYHITCDHIWHFVITILINMYDRHRIPKLPADKHFLDVSGTCSYAVHFGLGPFFGNSKKLFTLRQPSNGSPEAEGKIMIIDTASKKKLNLMYILVT